MTNYKEFRFSKINSPQFSHIKLLIFWVIYGIMFLFVERIYEVDFYIPMHSPLDDLIPFCEFFVIPYMYWFVFLVGTLAYLFFFDIPAFRRMMYFIIVTYSVTMVIYLLFPTCQNLRPVEFERDNIFTLFISHFYNFDTNTNVCPSIHVIGSFAAMFGMLDSKCFSAKGWRVYAVLTTVVISLSTVFLKQHSVWDVFLALPLCAIAYVVIYRMKGDNNVRTEGN